MSPIDFSRRVLTLCLSTVAALAVGALPVQADTIYTNFGKDDTYATGAGVLVTNDGLAWSSVAIAFTPSANYNLTSIEFVASALFPGDSSAIGIGVFADNSGQPDGAPLELFSAGLSGMFNDTVPVMTVTSVLQPLLLADTRYWIGMNAAPGDLIVWNQNVTSADGFSETDGNGNWSASDALQDQGVLRVDGTLAPMIDPPDPPNPPDPDQPDFADSSTPEPGALWLMAGGLTMLAIFIRQLRVR